MNKLIELKATLLMLELIRVNPPASFGICTNLTGLQSKFNPGLYWGAELGKYFESWSKFSGDLGYPVPEVEANSPFYQYHTTPDKWTGEYGDLRKELLDHLIICIRKDILNHIN